MVKNEKPLNSAKSGANQNNFNQEYTTVLHRYLNLSEIKQIPIGEVVRILKLKAFNNGRVRCPGTLHKNGDKIPSLKLYFNSNSWYCFTCGIGGSVIDLVMFVTHCNVSEAIFLLRGIR